MRRRQSTSSRSSSVASTLIKGFAGQIRAKDLEKLAKYKGLIVTENAAVRAQALLPTVSDVAPTSSQLWTYRVRHEQAVDGRQVGDDRDRRLGHRRLARGLQGTRQGAGQLRHLGVPERGRRRSRPRDVRRGYRGGHAPGYAGAAPNADIVSLDVMDDSGAGKTSDVIAAAEWIYRNKAAYNIRVANFSLHSGAVNHFWLDPLNVAVSKLWLSGVVVVAAAGNYGSSTGRAASPTHPRATPSWSRWARSTSAAPPARGTTHGHPGRLTGGLRTAS